MFKVIATDVVISKGYDGAPALKFSENGESVRFRIGKKVYDTRAESNTRWVNISVKAFGPVCERIKKMQLKESSFINILGRLDEDVWEDTARRMRKKAPWWSSWMRSSIARPAEEGRSPQTPASSPRQLLHLQRLFPTEICPAISPVLNPSAA